jgi:predicted nuclease of predicted toxin-antitoxin system
MRFPVDANLPPALAQWLRERGHAADHIAQIGQPTETDDAIWQRAIAADAILVSKDEDFARRRSIARQGPPSVIWVRMGNTRKPVLLARFAGIWGEVIAALERGDRLIEVR